MSRSKTSHQRGPLYRLCCVAFATLLCPAFAAEPLIVAHRGLLKHAPENTLANFRACLELRLGFEFDVARTKDGHLVCIHDDTVDRTTNGTGRVADMTLAEIRKLDAGSWFHPRFAKQKVPTIEEVMGLVGEYKHHKLLMAVDLKIAGAEKELVRMAQRHGILNRLLFIGRTISSDDLRNRLRKASAQAATSALANNAGEVQQAQDTGNANWVYVRYLPSDGRMKKIHGAKKKCFIAGKTVSGMEIDNWKRAGELGIDAILTDYPLALRRALQR